MLSERLRKASQPRSRNIFLFRGTIYFAIVRRRNDNLKYTMDRLVRQIRERKTYVSLAKKKYIYWKYADDIYNSK